ncbi:MAG TPA: hypothetical protein VGD95_05075 [Micavibrio sp.]
MSITTRFLKATTSAAVLAAAAGCATTTGLPEYRSVDAGTRTFGTPVDTQGVRSYQNGAPVAVHYNACRDLQTATRQVNNNRSVERSIDQASRKIGSAAGNRRSNLGSIISGSIAGVGAAIAGNEANKALKTPQISQLEADCNQQRAYEAWVKGQNASGRAGGAASTSERLNEKRVDDCVKAETRRGASYTQALPACRATIFGR